jgi:hypothetical protein
MNRSGRTAAVFGGRCNAREGDYNRLQRSLGRLGAGEAQVEAAAWGRPRPHDDRRDRATRAQHRRAVIAYRGEYRAACCR